MAYIVLYNHKSVGIYESHSYSLIRKKTRTMLFTIELAISYLENTHLIFDKSGLSNIKFQKSHPANRNF